MMEYTTPELRNLGSLATLTLGKAGSNLDGYGGLLIINDDPNTPIDPIF
jgi:hypothetical protein